MLNIDKHKIMHLGRNNPNLTYRRPPGSDVNMAWHAGVRPHDKQFCENGSLMPGNSQKCRSDVKCY